MTIHKYINNKTFLVVFLFGVFSFQQHLFAQKKDKKNQQSVEEKFVYTFFKAKNNQSLNNYSKAKELYLKCLELKEEPTIYYELSKVVSHESLTQAINYAKKAFELENKNKWFGYQYASLLYKNGQIEKADNVISPYIPSSNFTIHKLYVDIKVALEKWQLLETYYISLKGDNNVLIALSFSKKWRTNEAVLEVAKKQLLDYPRSYKLIKFIILNQLNNGSYDEAIQLFNKEKVNLSEKESTYLAFAIQVKSDVDSLSLIAPNYKYSDELVEILEGVQIKESWKLPMRIILTKNILYDSLSVTGKEKLATIKKQLLSNQELWEELHRTINNQSSLEEWINYLVLADKLGIKTPEILNKAELATELFPFQPQIFYYAAQLALKNNEKSLAKDWIAYGLSIVSPATKEFEDKLISLEKKLND